MKVIYVLTFLVIFLEMMFKIIVTNSVDIIGIIYTLLFSVPIILFLNLICNSFKEKISKIILIVFSTFLTLYFMVQAVFYNLFSIPFSFMTLGLAGNALTFTEIIKDAIIQNIVTLLVLSIPLVVEIILLRKIKFIKYDKNKILKMLSAIIGTVCILIAIIHINRDDLYSLYNLYYNINAQEKNIEKLGLLTSTGIDLQRTIFGFEEKLTVEVNNNIEIDEEVPEETKVTYNELDLNLEKLIEEATNENLKNIYKYINSVEPTNKNEYTGYFKDKNLIFILAEGFNSIAVNEELTPTLYKLVNSGFVFNKFYSPVFLSTTGGEFQATTGLIPTQETLNLWKKSMPKIEYALGNSFSKIGYTANAYHDWTYTYYSRQDTMKTLGFTSYMGIGNGLEKLMSSKWLPSDVDMIDVTTDFYTSEDKFVTFYITVSGHAPYNFTGGNSIAIKNKQYVNDLPYSSSIKAYLASQIELDKAVEKLINNLEEKGILKDTVIALVGDHYPYTIDIDEINLVSSYERDSIVEVNRSNFIIWNSEIENSIKIDKVGSQIDVLPTLLNLFGVEYDSRTIIGQDILSDNPGIAIFSNRSWVSDYGTYFSAQKNFVPNSDTLIEDNYVANINKSVANKFTMSNLFVKYNIYENMFGQN